MLRSATVQLYADLTALFESDQTDMQAFSHSDHLPN